MKTADFDYELPPGSIAQHPAPERDAARLLVLDRAAEGLRHARFRDLPSLLRPGDLLVANDTRVLPARLFARVRRGGGGHGGSGSGGVAEAGDREVEVLLLREEPDVPPERIWSVLAKPARVLQPGVELSFADPSWHGRVHSMGERGKRRIAFRPVAPGGGAGVASAGEAGGEKAPSFETWLSHVGHVPLPPYIERADEPEDRERYQTVFARDAGSVAAPTAGLHFTAHTIAAAKSAGATFATVTLHVGPGTFRPVATENAEDHVLDSEAYRVPPETAAAIAAAKRVIAVGTTSVRSLESWARDGRPDDGAWRETALFVRPPFEFQVVEAMITNFHLPRSSLLFLVSAFAGRERVLDAYAVAVREGYRFYSYGDAMLIL
ncbi:MAG TPA: tRNA preQ1(34) S-adenosylmethionine ribosyltransferase-isomerase QueA [Acidobacteriota bacterium]|nr:tRNA preQ1(34) S-adenosylmethionine ribosyltransferase-isomerase QueA [Acidobacteriota bacterium]